jgi:hypothetical protein
MKPISEGSVYRMRFLEQELAQGGEFWRSIWGYLQRFADPQEVTLDPGGQNFDHFDYRRIFTHKGMAEGLAISDFNLQHVIARFLPCTSKSGLPKASWMVSAYPAFPPGTIYPRRPDAAGWN